ncbi:MAG: AzlD domain-containing protein, partial [Pseudomonadota bacterium]
YVPVAVMPAIAAPMVVWPEATGGLVEPSRLLAAAAVIAVGVVTRSVLGAIFAGIVTVYTLGAVL